MSAIVSQKIIAKDIFQCGDINKFAATILQVLDYKGVSLSNFYLCELDGIRFLTKLSFYLKSMPEIYNNAPLAEGLLSTVDTEVKSLQLLRAEVINKGVSPGIVELVYHNKCESITVPDKSSPLYAHFNNISSDHKKLMEAGLADTGLVFIVLERCDVTIDTFSSHAHDNPVSIAIMRSLIFQIVYTLHALRTMYPGFKHNDLHSSNVMLRVDTGFAYSASRPKYMKYTVGTTSYFVPYFGIVTKIIDFAFAQFPSVGIKSSFTADPIGMYSRTSDDLDLLLKDLLEKAPKGIQDMLEKVMKAGAGVGSGADTYDYERILATYSDYEMQIEPVSNSIFGRYSIIA